MKFNSILIGTEFKRLIKIQAGESVEVSLLWKNSNQSARDMGNASVLVKVKDGRQTKVYEDTLTDPAMLYIPADTTSPWKGKYEVEVWEQRLTAVPPTTSAGTFMLEVEP